jgi:hypothetical protein
VRASDVLSDAAFTCFAALVFTARRAVVLACILAMVCMVEERGEERGG